MMTTSPMNSVWRMIQLLGLAATLTACAPLHATGDLVESGGFNVERKGTDYFHIGQVMVYADADGTHIHGTLHRQRSTSGHIEITLLDQDGAVLYEDTLTPSALGHLSKRIKVRSVIRKETFHLVVEGQSPGRGTVRIVYHPGQEHDVQKPQ